MTETNAQVAQAGQVPTRRTVFIHIGTRKSGTSFLQKALRGSVPALREQDLDLTYHTRKGHVERQLEPFREYAAGGSADASRASVEEMIDRISRRPESRHLITLEDLSEQPEKVADLMVGPLKDFDVHIIVTARHWGKTIPSEWQQIVKERKQVTYRDFLDAIRDRTPAAEQFLARQDLPAILQRWGRLVPAERVHVIAVPPSSRAEGTLMELFCGLIGIDPTTLAVPGGDVNTSISLEQAELLRRVNVALGDRLPTLEGDYRYGVREWLTRGTLMRHKRGSILIPAEDAAWCAQAIQAQYDGIVALGVDIVGDPADLLPPAEAPTGRSMPSDAEVNEVAVKALADLANRNWEQIAAQRAERDSHAAELKALTDRIAELEAPQSFRERLRALRG